MKASFKKHTFYFKRPSGTSRGVLTEKHSWFIELFEENNPSIKGIGECSIIPGLSPDFVDFESYEIKLNEVCLNLEKYTSNFDLLNEFPSILFGLETALLDLQNGGKQIIFNNSFSSGDRRIPINGLIWMGDADFMQEQIEQKLEEGFSCLKMKIGAIDFESELKILESIRNRFSSDKITLRVDANGAFPPSEALSKLERLSEFDIHSIEQPIRQGQWAEMKQLCTETKVPIALDEELIGITALGDRKNLLDTIQPQFIILKPSLHGGITGCKEWISLAEERSIPWWITSALESNIGLNAVCQFTGEYANNLPQGLGTGGLYTNNIESNLTIENGEIYLKKHE
ncbi:MAG: o-succinylbenzoate synthase [Fluviicola sp.]|jgi:o-succinylbenzoate synthase|nr:o-succinylbenzoate synthase [Fluviicola sp.]